jgi:acetyl/propionyl-CoA carboxylase alpha subunit
VRNDSGVFGGSEISIHYDPMIAKLIVWGRDREESLRRLARAIDELRIVGIRTNVPLFQALLADADFRAARFDIHWLDRKLESGELAPVGGAETPEIALIAAAIAHYERSQRQVSAPPQGAALRGGWRAAARNGALRRGGRG